MQESKLISWKLLSALFALVCSLYITGCASKQLNKNRIDIAKNVDVELLSPQSFGEEISLSQLAEFSVGENQHELLFQTEITNDKVVVVGLMPSGVRLFSIIYDGTEIISEGYSSLIEKIKPGYLLADMQLSLWPIDAIRNRFENSSKCFKANRCSIKGSTKERYRKIEIEGKEIVSIHYKRGKLYRDEIHFHHKVRDYSIKLTPLDVYTKKQQ